MAGRAEALIDYDARMAAIEENRRQFDLNYNNINLPTSIGQNTGFLPTGYIGGYGGLPTFGALTGSTDMFGEIGSNLDPRYAALGYTAGQKTLQGRQLDLQGDAQRAREREDALRRQLMESSQRFTEMDRNQQRFLDQRNKDTQLELETGVPYLDGSPMPEWMRPHAEWVHQWQEQHDGTPPTYQALVENLGRMGMQPEDFNGGRPYPGTVPTLAPGVLPQGNGKALDMVAGKQIDASEANTLGAQRRAQAGIRVDSQNPLDANGQPNYLATQQAGFRRTASEMAAPGQDGLQMERADGMMNFQTGGQGPGGNPEDKFAGDSLMNFQAMGGNAAPGGINYQGSGAAGSNFSGQVKSQAQRELEERARQSDVQAQIQNKQIDLRNALDQGNLDLARKAQQDLNALEQQKLGVDVGALTGSYNGQDTLEKQRLNEQGRQFDQRLGFDKGVATGTVDGQETLDRGALLGTFNGMSTLAGQQAYGGSALVGGGLTLDAQKALGKVGGQQTLDAQNALGYIDGQKTLARQGQEADTGLRTAQLMAQLQGPANAFAQQAAINGLNQAGLSNAVDAIAGRRSVAGFQGAQAPVQAASLESVQRQLQGGFGGPQQAGMRSIGPATQGPESLRAAVMPQRPDAMSGFAAGSGGGMAATQKLPTFGGAAPVTDINAYKASLPSLNKINGREYAKMGTATKQFLGSAYKGAGYINDQSELDEAANKALPGYAKRRAVPTFGRIAA
jgi:hypothetical protein